MATEKSTTYVQDGGGIMPLRPSDLVFNKTPDGIMSCGYMVKNAILNSTLNMQPQIGGAKKIKFISDNDAKLNVNKSKIMEDLVVPSSLYYCRPIYKHKVFNCTKGDCDNIVKKNNSKSKSKNKDDEFDESDEEEYHDNSVINESLYDKLLSLVSPDKRMKYDNKTRKVKNDHLKGTQSRKSVSHDEVRETPNTGETRENKKIVKNKNTMKNANINKNKRTRKTKIVMP
jgi:hypothetical protein